MVNTAVRHCSPVILPIGNEEIPPLSPQQMAPMDQSITHEQVEKNMQKKLNVQCNAHHQSFSILLGPMYPSMGTLDLWNFHYHRLRQRVSNYLYTNPHLVRDPVTVTW